MWYHQIHDQDFYNKEIDVYKGKGRFTLLFNSKQKGNIYEFYLLFWEKFLKKIYFEVKINWPFMEERVKGKEFSYFFDLLNDLTGVFFLHREVIIPNKIYMEEEDMFFEDIFMYDENTGENIWTKKWSFKIWNFSYVKRNFLIWINNLDVFVYNVYKEKYEKPVEIIFNNKSENSQYKNNFIYDNSNKKQDTDVLYLIHNIDSLDELRKNIKVSNSEENMGFYFKPLNFFLNKVEENIKNTLSKYHVYIKGLRVSEKNDYKKEKKIVYGFITFDAYIDIKEEVNIDELLNKLNKDFKDYKVEIQKNYPLNSSDIKYQIILTFDVLLFRFWDNFISTSLKENEEFIQRNRNNINFYSFENIGNNLFLISNNLYENDENNILKRLVWYEYKKINFSVWTWSYKIYKKDNFDYVVLINNSNHVIIMKDWIELINDEIIPSINIPDSYLSFWGWRNYVAYQVKAKNTKDIEYVIYDFSESKIRKIYLRNEDKFFKYSFGLWFEDVFLFQEENDVEEKKEKGEIIRKIRFPISNMKISVFSQNEYILNYKVNKKRNFPNWVFSNRNLNLKNGSTLNYLDETKLLYIHVWLKGFYQCIPFIPILKKLWTEDYDNTDFEKNFYCSNVNSKFLTQPKNDYFSLWNYLSKNVLKINTYLNTNLDNWKFWSFVFKKKKYKISS